MEIVASTFLQFILLHINTTPSLRVRLHVLNLLLSSVLRLSSTLQPRFTVFFGRAKGGG